MNTEELYKLQYEVIADYPHSPFKIGDIIKFSGIVFGTGRPQEFVRNPEKYPQIFKLINKDEKF